MEPEDLPALFSNCERNTVAHSTRVRYIRKERNIRNERDTHKARNREIGNTDRRHYMARREQPHTPPPSLLPRAMQARSPAFSFYTSLAARRT